MARSEGDVAKERCCGVGPRQLALRSEGARFQVDFKPRMAIVHTGKGLIALRRPTLRKFTLAMKDPPREPQVTIQR